jgi:hypothetical protein
MSSLYRVHGLRQPAGRPHRHVVCALCAAGRTGGTWERNTPPPSSFPGEPPSQGRTAPDEQRGG